MSLTAEDKKLIEKSVLFEEIYNNFTITIINSFITIHNAKNDKIIYTFSSTCFT